MAYVLLDADGVVVQKQPYDQAGFTQAPDHVVCGWVYDGDSFSAPVASFEDAKADLRLSVNALIEAKMSAGYEHDFGAAGVHRLQTRESDRPNWLALAQVASIAAAQGGGSVVISSIRTEGNVTIPVSADEAVAAMLGMQAQLGAVMSHGWGLKDAIEAAGDEVALNAINIEAGWPA
jgi:hypothetical protein